MSDNTLHYKEYCLDKYDGQDMFDLINRKLLIHKQLEKPPRTYVVYSDLHGSYEKFLHWLKNGMGYYKIAVQRVLGDSYSSQITECYEQLLLIVSRTRFEAIERFIESDEEDFNDEDHFLSPVAGDFADVVERLELYGLTRRRVLLDNLKLLREITLGDERRIIKLVPQRFLENILKLFHQNDRESFEGLVEGVVENETIYNFILSLVVKLIVNNVFDKHINLGDTFDRGEGADKLMKLYRSQFGGLGSDSPLHYIWGNHDILWLGAGIGNPILAVEAIRVSMRYNNLDFLGRYGFDLSLLEEYAKKTYRVKPTGKYIKSNDFSDDEIDLATKMTKALLVIQLKLTLAWLGEVKAIPGAIDYGDEWQRHLDLLRMLPKGIEEDPKVWQNFCKENPLFLDCYFPTFDAEDPSRLTDEEQEVADGIVRQFITLPKVQRDVRWLFEKGETYRVVDNTLYFHAAIPSTENFELHATRGRSGKVLLDFIQRDLKRIALKHQENDDISLGEKMLLWHLWCGTNSPFFCKSKMATLERAVFVKEEAASNPLTTHAEISNPFYKNIRVDRFLSRLLSEFHAEKICMGHTPIKSVRQAILSDSIRAFIVDGGASEAYGDRGVVLINTPEYSYLTFHPSLGDLKRAEAENRLPDIQTNRLEERGRLRLRHMEKGYFLNKELEAINELLTEKLPEFNDSYFYR